jgi:hypothetical protein
LIRKPEEKRSLGRPKLRWEDNLKMYSQEIGFGNMNGIHLAENSIQP